MKLFKKFNAVKNKVPMTIKEYWQAYYVDFNSDGKLLYGGTPIIFSNNSNIGDEFPLINKGGMIHTYQVVDISYAPGDDHIVSPKQFDLEYVRSTNSE